MPPSLHISTLHGQQSFPADSHTDPRVLSDFLAHKGLALNTRCCGRGLCKGCAVRLDKGELLDSDSGDRITVPGEILSCRVEWIEGTDVSLTIPDRSLMAHRPVVEDDFEIKVPVGENPLFEGKFGFAVDIGTTTVVVLLAELSTGRVLARASSFNQQIRFGDDVLTRIEICQGNPGMLLTLQDAICRETLLPLAREACAKAGIELEQVGGMSIAGNTTMLHLLFGVDPTPMGMVPFTPNFLDHRVRQFGELGICEVPNLPLHVLPGLAAYVGADISAGIFSTGLHYETEPMLLVDVGTNGEIVLRKDGRCYGCATAAGPAFEGSGLSCGMRATPGAIEEVEISAGSGNVLSISTKTIGKKPVEQASGICGSAYIDFLAQARSAGVLMDNGRFDETVMAANPDLFFKAPFGSALRLGGSDNQTHISEPDVALLLQAKGAIAAGIETLLARVDLTPGEIKGVYLAGGFGMHIDVTHAIQCGLLPGFLPEQVKAVGNTSLGGAYLALLDQTVIDELDRIRAEAEIIELNNDPDFEDRYIDNLRLP